MTTKELVLEIRVSSLTPARYNESVVELEIGDNAYVSIVLSSEVADLRVGDTFRLPFTRVVPDGE